MSKTLNVDLSGRVCLITGANTGIGKEVARGLARMGAHVVLACRSEARGRSAQKDIVATTGNDRIEVMTVDLSNQPSIRQFAQDFRARHDKLHVLINNAGIWPKTRALSVDGIEMTWATNMLGYYLLTMLLIDLLKASAPARIINVASDLAKNLDLGDVQFEHRNFSAMMAYAQTKQANRMFTWALAKRLEGAGVTANAVHPGTVITELLRNQGGLSGAVLDLYFRLFGRTPEKGAETLVWLATAPELDGVTGKFWYDLRERKCPYRDPKAIEQLWRLCAEMTQNVKRET